jgi:hypothetical protein
MIALILLILAVVVVGGGIEVVRRMRFGSGAAAAHHRALDTLGHLTNQGADHRVDLAPAAATPLLDHVRRVVESDPTHPRISPRPMSRPVTIPAAVIGTDPSPATSAAVATHPAATEIEGVRILLPDPPAPDPGPGSVSDGDADTGTLPLSADDTDRDVPPDGAGEDDTDGFQPDQEVGDEDDDDDHVPAGVAFETEVDDGPADHVDADEGDYDDESPEAGEPWPGSEGLETSEVWMGTGPVASGENGDRVADPGDDHEGDLAGDREGDAGDGRVAAAEAATAVVVRLDDEATDSDTVGGGAEEPVLDAATGEDPVDGGAVLDPGSDEDPVGDGAGTEEGALPAGARNGTATGDEVRGVMAGTPVSPPTAVDGAESVRVVRVDDLDPRGDGGSGGLSPDRPHRVEPPLVGEPTASTSVTAAWGGQLSWASQGEVEGFRILSPAGAGAAPPGPGASEPGADGPAALAARSTAGSAADAERLWRRSGGAPAALDDRPRRRSGPAPAVAGGFQPAAPEQTRAQLAALARSGGVEPVGGAAGANRPHHRRGRRSGGHGRSTRHPARHRGLRVATATLAVIVVAVGIVSAVVIGDRGSHTRVSQPPPVTAASPTTAPAMPAALVSQTASTATYQLTGTPTISLVGSGSCWVQIRQGDQSGKVIFEGVLSSGTQKTQTGPFWVRLGNPSAVSVQVNGVVLNQPASNTGNPYNLQFQ